MRYLGNHVETRRLAFILTHRKLRDVREMTELPCASASSGVRRYYYVCPTYTDLRSHCETNGENQDSPERHLECQREVGCSDCNPQGQQPSLTDLPPSLP